MKLLLLFVHLFLINTNSQLTDSVNLRVYNNSRYIVKEYIVNINKTHYSFTNIAANSYSQHKRLPYIYDSNSDDITILIKGFLRSTYTIRAINMPIDNIGDKKINNGSATLILNVTVHHKKLNFKTILKQE